jgi:hypothetical protein
MDGRWMEGWMDGRTGRQMDGWIMDRKMNGQTDGRTNLSQLHQPENQ